MKLIRNSGFDTLTPNVTKVDSTSFILSFYNVKSPFVNRALINGGEHFESACSFYQYF